MRVPTAAIGIAIFNLEYAQNMSYGADKFFQSENATVWPITFPTIYHTAVAGNLFLMKALTAASSANLYTAKMAEQGFVAVSIDLPFYGGSEGSPRNAVLPDLYSEGISAAVDHLGLQCYIDRKRIGAIGICGSGGFVISAAKVDSRISAVATSSMYDMGALNYNGLGQSQSVSVSRDVIAQASEQRWVEAAGGNLEWSIGTPLEITNASTAIDRELYDYYRTSRGLYTPASFSPNVTMGRTVTSNLKFINFYTFDDFETISPRPLLFIAGDLAHSREFSEDAYAGATKPKELL